MYAVIGLGITGTACVQYLHNAGHDLVVMDAHHDACQKIQKLYPKVRIASFLDPLVLSKVERVVISPGVPLSLLNGLVYPQPVWGDIECFAQAHQGPVLGITGSNGKSTVTTLMGQAAKTHFRNVVVAGNIGTSVLQYAPFDANDIYVLELSSFQLETTQTLRTEASVILNVTPDHLDRYSGDIHQYLQAKQRIYTECAHPIVNADQSWIYESLPLSSCVSFSVEHHRADFYIMHTGHTQYLMHRGKRIADARILPVRWKSYLQNVLVVLAFSEIMGFDQEKVLEIVAQFKGLPHRCQWVRRINNVDWYNDSKATNIGATESALVSLGQDMTGKIILLLGGIGKGSDFSDLLDCVQKYTRALIVFGQDAPCIQKALECSEIPIHVVNTLKEAVLCAQDLSHPQDCVLLAPACASLDQFKDYADRGTQFTKWVGELKEK